MKRPALILVAALLALGACEGASDAQKGDPDYQGANQADEQGQGTEINDTTPHRPGQSSQP